MRYTIRLKRALMALQFAKLFCVCSLFIAWSGTISQAQPATDWRSRVDEYWGRGLPVDEQLSIFDTYWRTADSVFAAFASAPVDWDAQRIRYRSEIETGASRGRFAAILNHLALSLRESHTFAIDSLVNVTTVPRAGVPLLYPSVKGDNGHFGACLTPLPDSTLLVYKVADDHPLGLHPGDVVVGYDGVPWKTLYPRLLGAELPLYWGTGLSVNGDPPGWSRPRWGAARSAYEHDWLTAAGLNWHLFKSITLIRYATGQTQQQPTALLQGHYMPIRCTEQLPVPGVPPPSPRWTGESDQLGPGEYVSFGIVEGTSVGYIYVWSWFYGQVSRDFRDAIAHLQGNPEIKGIIIDFRFNHGGFVSVANEGFSILFKERIETLEMLQRSSASDRYKLVESESWAEPLYIDGNPDTYFDQPIAVLSGPGAFSAGDFNILRLRYHARVRVFGKPSSAAFTPALRVKFPDGFYGTMSYLNALKLDVPEELLVHSEQQPDESVWLTPETVSDEQDNVANRALDWIKAQSVEFDKVNPPFVATFESVTPNPASDEIVAWVAIPSVSRVRLELYDMTGRYVMQITDEFLSEGRHPLRFSVNRLSGGAYVLHVSLGDKIYMRTLFVVR